MLGKEPNKVYDPFLNAGLGYKNPESLKKAIAAQPKMYDGEMLHSTMDSVVKERENIKLEYQKLFNSIKATRTQHQKELDELIEHVNQKTYAYADVRAKSQDLLMTITELKNKLKIVDKGKNVNTMFDKSKTSGTLLCVTPFPKNIVVKAKKVSNTKEKCVAHYALSRDSKVKRALFTTPIAVKSTNLGATFVVAKSRLSVVKTPTTTNKSTSGMITSQQSLDMEIMFKAISRYVTKMKPKADIGIFIGYSESSRGFRINNRRSKKIMETIHVKFDELTAMASKCNNLEPGLNFLNFQDSSEDSQSVPLKTDLDNLFSPLYEEYYPTSPLKVSDNSAANTLDNENASASSSIVVEENEAPQIVSSSTEKVKPNTPILNENADEVVQEDVAEFDGNVFYYPSQTPVFEEAESSSTYQDL
ncbi:hypothetical protein Tco_0591429 [Tanacetum coccineum]